MGRKLYHRKMVKSEARLIALPISQNKYMRTGYRGTYSEEKEMIALRELIVTLILVAGVIATFVWGHHQLLTVGL